MSSDTRRILGVRHVYHFSHIYYFYLDAGDRERLLDTPRFCQRLAEGYRVLMQGTYYKDIVNRVLNGIEHITTTGTFDA